MRDRNYSATWFVIQKEGKTLSWRSRAVFFWRKHPIRDVDLSAYVDGQLEPPARDRLEAHIETCTPCREALAELRALRSALRELPPATAPRSFALREADVRGEPKPSLMPARPPALLGGLASVALVAFVALVGVDVLGQPPTRGDADATGAMAPEALEDGAKVPLSAGDAAVGATPTLDVAMGLSSERTEPGLKITATMLDGLTDNEAGPDTNQRGEIGGSDETPADALATPECPPGRECKQLSYNASGEAEPAPEGMPEPAPEAAPEAIAAPADDSRLPLRVGEAAAAAVALVAGGSFALIWRRRRV